MKNYEKLTKITDKDKNQDLSLSLSNVALEFQFFLGAFQKGRLDEGK